MFRLRPCRNAIRRTARLTLLSLALTCCGPTPTVKDRELVNYKGKEYEVIWYKNNSGQTYMRTIQDPFGDHYQVLPDSKLSNQIEALATAARAARNGSGAGISSSVRGGAVGRAVASAGSVSVYLLDLTFFYQFDPASNQVSKVLNLSLDPLAGSPTRFKVTSDGKFAVITTNTGDRHGVVLIVDLASFTVAAHIQLGANTNLGGIAVTPDDLSAYVVKTQFDTGQNAVIVVDLTARTIATTIPLPDDQDLTSIVMSPDGAEAYLGCNDCGMIKMPVIDIPSNTVSMRVALDYYSTQTGLLSGIPAAYLAMHPDGSRVYLAPLDGSPVRVLDTATKTITKLIQVPQGKTPPFGSDPHFTPDGRFLFVLNAPNAISVIDTVGDTLSTTLPLRDDVANQPPGAVHIGFFFVPDQ
jgi:DNA-binding beta-propeller fold protein YncE